MAAEAISQLREAKDLSQVVHVLQTAREANLCTPVFLRLIFIWLVSHCIIQNTEVLLHEVSVSWGVALPRAEKEMYFLSFFTELDPVASLLVVTSALSPSSFAL